MKKYILPLLVAVIGFTGFQAFALSLPSGTGVFQTSLQSRITSTDSSMTLTSTSTRGGGALPSGYHCFTIDEGLSAAEWVCGTLTAAKTITGLERGLDPNTGTTTISSLKFGHRVGASVKITDFPLIQRLKELLNGDDTIPNIMHYAATVCSVLSSNSSICDKAYIDGVAVAGASNANETTKGIIEIATQTEAASTTNTGSTGARLVIPSSMATSSPYTPGLYSVMTRNDGTISPSMIATSSSNIYTWAASTTFSGLDNFVGTTTDNGTVGGLTPVGSITAYATTTAPAGWLLCDGSAVSRSSYWRLFRMIGTSYGVGDGSTTFNLPNLQGRMIEMATTSPSTTMGQTGGATSATITTSNLPALSVNTFNNTTNLSTSPTSVTGTSNAANGTISVNNTGTNSPLNLQNPYIVLEYIIKY